MYKNFYYFRPGIEARMQARCKFGKTERGCGATLTYPIKGYAWRRNPMKSIHFEITEEIKNLLFSEAQRLHKEFPDECLIEGLYNDASSEKANGITRDLATKTPCNSISIINNDHSIVLHYSIKENSPALINSALYQIISSLIKPYEYL
jgi:hypothetical protein